MNMHRILSARYATPEPQGGYPGDASVIAVHVSYGEQSRRANDDIDGGGMLAYLASGGVIEPYVTPKLPAPTPDDVIRERERRLALGFDYDFGDTRGIHHIGSTTADMLGWDEVTKLASALVATGDTTTLITIVTDTGPAQVTALEWQSVLLAAGAYRQPIWAASFALQYASPIPVDYTDDGYWP